MINIIIPYYNASATIERALHSIAMQTTYRKIIVTIVDDCSNELVEYWDDKNKIMVKNFTKTFLYENIFPKFSTLNINYLCNDKNQGPGAARNIGIKNSFCDWIMFLDSDDALANPTTIETINVELQRERPDILLTRFQQQTDNELVSMPLENRTWVHGKVFKSSFLKENKILFPEIKANEDSSFCSVAFAFAKEIFKFDFITYCWINNKKSMVRFDKDYYGNYLNYYIQGKIYSYNKIKELKDNEILIDEILSSLIIIYWQFLDLYFYRKDILDNYLEEVKNYLRIIEIKKYIKDEDFLRRLSIRYWKEKVKPHYGPLIPSVSLLEFYNSLISGIYNWS